MLQRAGVTHAAVVELNLFHPAHMLGQWIGGQVTVHGQVDDAPAAAAHEVGVGRHHAVVVHIAAVDGERLHGVVRVQQLQRVIHRGARQRGHGRKQVVIDGIDRRVRVMLHEIFHDGHTLH